MNAVNRRRNVVLCIHDEAIATADSIGYRPQALRDGIRHARVFIIRYHGELVLALVHFINRAKVPHSRHKECARPYSSGRFLVLGIAHRLDDVVERNGIVSLSETLLLPRIRVRVRSVWDTGSPYDPIVQIRDPFLEAAIIEIIGDLFIDGVIVSLCFLVYRIAVFIIIEGMLDRSYKGIRKCKNRPMIIYFVSLLCKSFYICRFSAVNAVEL